MTQETRLSLRQLDLTALGLAVAASAAIIVLPSFTVTTETSSISGHSSALTVVEAIGPRALIIALVPVVLTAMPLLPFGRAARPLRICATVTLAVFVALGSLSVGWLFVPALIVSVIAVLRRQTAPAQPRGDQATD